MPVNTILILALSAAFITSWSLIEPPGWTIILTPALTKILIPSAKGKKASEAAIEFFILDGWKFFAFFVAILQLSNLLGWPAPTPIVEKLFVSIMALDLTNLQTLNANSISLSSVFDGLFLVTNLSSL